MLGLSYGEIFLTLGAIAALMGPKDLPIIGRTAGRIAGRAIGYVQIARGQLNNIMHESQFRQVNKELRDTMAQLDAIRHEIRSISIMNPGPMTRTVMDGPDKSAADSEPQVIQHENQELKSAFDFSKTVPQAIQHENRELKRRLDLSKVNRQTVSDMTDVHSQATTYAQLAESSALRSASMKCGADSSSVGEDDKPGLLSVLPVSAEYAGLLPKRQGDRTGSDIVLEAVLEAELVKPRVSFPSQKVRSNLNNNCSVGRYYFTT